MKVKLTQEEKELFKGNREILTDFMNAKAVLEEVKGYAFEEAEKAELDYFTTIEKVKYFISLRTQDKIDISAEEVAKIYTENKKEFDAQKIQFSEAKKIIENDMYMQQLAYLESQEITEMINNLQNDVLISKEEILFSNGNAEILKTIITNKIIMSEFEKAEFSEQDKKAIDNIEKNVLANFYVELQVRKTVQVTQAEVEEFYNARKAEFGEMGVNEAHNQILNYLFEQKIEAERARIITEIAEKHNVEKLVEENL